MALRQRIRINASTGDKAWAADFQVGTSGPHGVKIPNEGIETLFRDGLANIAHQ